MNAIPGFELGTVARALPGSSVSGDVVAVSAGPESLLVGLADGLGHGSPAAVAASAFSATVLEHAGDPLAVILRQADRRLHGTRGAVAALLRADGPSRRIEVLVVGNVAFRARAAKKLSVLSMPGVLGRLGGNMPRSFAFDLSPGDVVVLHSDGVVSPELESIDGMAVEEAAAALIARHAREDDDASCAVLRCVDAGRTA